MDCFPALLHVAGRQAVRLRGLATSTESAGPPRKFGREPRCTKADTSRRNRAGYTPAYTMQGEVNKDYNPRRQRIAVYRDPGGFYVYLVAVRLTVASLPYLTAGVSWARGARDGLLTAC